MIGLGAMELLILFCVGIVWLGVIAAVVVMSRRPTNLPAPAAAPPLPAAAGFASPPSPVADDADARQTIIARLTHRFCPQCRSPVAADAPEGLCPACLMAGGLASVAPESAVNGMAITTPPSGSQPPASGEWADLQQHFPELEILELLGRGGMGAVYKARQKNLDRLLALKVIPPDAAKDPAFIERFNREARAMARLNHPNIVTVYNFGHSGDLCWLTMEYVDGVNLRHTLQASRLDPREALAIVPQICDALQYAHDQGVVHRDIKPENVLLDRTGRVKIADFGLAKLLGKGPDEYTLTRTQQVMGTPRYMAPEQIEKPTTVDHRADIYSLGVVIYEMLTGELPLGRFEPPSHKVRVDVRIDDVVMRTLEKEPERRYQRASHLKTELASASSWPAAAAAYSAPVPPQPSWQTPSPATKMLPGSLFGDLPPGAVLGVAAGMVVGILVMTAGLAAGLYGLIYSISGASNAGTVWGWWGAGFGCLVGGFGALAGSYNSYRQLAGAEDLLRSPRVTWFDWVVRGYFLFGILLIVAGLWDFPDGNPHPVSNWPYFLIGSLATFQATLFMLWRMVIRPATAAGYTFGTSSQRSLPAQPGYLRAVLLPTAAVLGVLILMGIDLSYTSPNYGLQSGRVSGAMVQLVDWSKALVSAGLVLVPLSLVSLGAWRMWGPRVAAPSGEVRVPYPFAAHGWLWGTAALAMFALLLPWFCLRVENNAEIAVEVKQAYHNSGDGITSIVARADSLRTIAAMPDGQRYAHRGIEIGGAATACLLVAFAAVLVSFVARPGETWRGIFLAACGGVSLLLVVVLLHDMLNNPTWLAIDSRTESGLSEFLTRLRGERPHSVAPLLPALRDGFGADPAIGMFLALAAGGFALFLGITELCWGPEALLATSTAAIPAAKSPPLDPVREAIRRRVAGPAIGLMIAGAIGLFPLLLALIVIPTAVLVPSAKPYAPPETRIERAPVGARPVASAAALAAAVLPGANPAVGPAIAMPFILAQEGPPMADSIPRFFLLVPFLALFYLLDLAISITLIVAGWRMRQLKSYGLSLVAAILAMLPCTFGWIIGLPIGIWAFAILQRPEVREAFEG